MYNEKGLFTANWRFFPASFTQANNETGVALCNGVYASESAACSEDSVSCNNTKKKANLAKEVPGTSNKIMIMIITRILSWYQAENNTGKKGPMNVNGDKGIQKHQAKFEHLQIEF